MMSILSLAIVMGQDLDCPVTHRKVEYIAGGIVLKIFISLLFFICISCGTRNKEYAENVFPYSEFPHEKELKGEVIKLDTALFRCPFRIRVEGDKAIVMDLHGIDYYAHLFQYPSFQYLSSFGSVVIHLQKCYQ